MLAIEGKPEMLIRIVSEEMKAKQFQKRNHVNDDPFRMFMIFWSLWENLSLKAKKVVKYFETLFSTSNFKCCSWCLESL